MKLLEENAILMLELVERIRAHVNDPRQQFKLLKDSHKWNSICSAMDCIGDTCGVLKKFVHPASKQSWETSLLRIYGALQALIVQQDAAKSLADAMGHPFIENLARHPDLQDIREIRNRAVGHPSEFQSTRKRKPSSFIQQPTITPLSFGLMIVESTMQDTQTVDMPDLILRSL